MPARLEIVSNTSRSPRYRWEMLALLCGAFFFHQADRALFGVVLSEIKADMALTDGEVGLVGSVLFFLLALMLPVAGYFGDRWNRKSIIVSSLIFWSLATLCTGFTSGFISLILFRSVATAGGESFYPPAAFSLIAAHHTRTRSLAFSIHQTALYVGVMVTGFLGGFIAERWGWRSAFVAFGGGGIVLGLILMLRLMDAPVPVRVAGASRASVWDSFGVVFRSPSALLLSAGFAAMVFVNNAFVVWAPVFLQEKFALSLMEAGGYAMFYHHLAALLGILACAGVSDRLAGSRPLFRPVVMSVSILVAVVPIFLMGWLGSLAGVCAAMAVFGFCRGAFEANTHAALFEVVAPRHRASAVGVMSMLAMLIGSLSPWLLGLMREANPPGKGLGLGFSALSGAYLVGGVAVAGAVIFTFSREKHAQETARESDLS
jgi:MFS transporter, Spinster family, sphingosine-1-phosphate transporter